MPASPASRVQQSLEAAGYEMRAQIIWRKSHFAIGRATTTGSTSPAGAVRKGGKRKWTGDRKQGMVWDIAGLR